MDIDRATPLLGGLSARNFMRRHWQKKPLLVRGALPGALAGLDPRDLFALAARDDVESRLVVAAGGCWRMRHGPIPRGALPARKTPGWTLLVQGVDLHDDAARRLLDRFRFVPDARLDDVMLSFASDRGGVGPHVDSYDVFLLQIAGQRRWRIGRGGDRRLRDDVPFAMLAAFEAEAEWLLGPGDMLYLPPGWNHDGVAEGPCVTCSIGFRAPCAREVAADTLQRLLEAVAEDAAAGRDAGPIVGGGRRYRDAGQAATPHPARIPATLRRFADAAIARLLADAGARRRALGEVLSEPKPGTQFAPRPGARIHGGAVLDRRTRMLYDERHVYINGESYHASGADAAVMRRLADRRRLDDAGAARLGSEARRLLDQWAEAGWCAPASDGLPLQRSR